MGYRSSTRGDDASMSRQALVAGQWDPPRRGFLTTKFNANCTAGWSRGLPARRPSRRRLHRPNVSHWTNPWRDRYVDAGRAPLSCEKGDVRAIGSRLQAGAHRPLLAETGRHGTQLSARPSLARAQTSAYHAPHRVVTGSWSPLGRGGPCGRPGDTERATARQTPAQVAALAIDCWAGTNSADPYRLTANLQS